MNCVWFYHLLLVLHLSALKAHAEPYEIPLDFIHNGYTEKLLQIAVANINKVLDGNYLIFDVPRAQSKLTNVIEYQFELVLAEHECDGRRGKNAITFADCGIISGKFLGYKLPNNVEEIFMAFQQKYRRFYTTQTAKTRFRVFKRNLLMIQLLQALDRGNAEYGVTAFADLDQNEFKNTHANLKKDQRMPMPMKAINVEKLPESPHSFDWRTKGAVTEVKNQGFCGSCWAFGTVGNIETQWFLKNGTLLSLSDQQLLDCDDKDEACNGGLPEWAFPAIIKMGGLMSETNYPYEAHKESSCHLVKNNVSARIDDWAQLPKDEELLASWLAANGTITVGINANFLQFYFGGISHPPHFLCSDTGLDHAVLLVGYGVSSILARPYWIVKNSWGSSWGESGYFRLYRGDGTCGINADATTSIIY